MRFGSRGSFAPDTPPKWIDREGLGIRLTGSKQSRPELLTYKMRPSANLSKEYKPFYLSYPMTYFVQRWRPFPFSPFFVSLTDSRITAKEITYKTCNSNIQSGMFSNNVCAFFISQCLFLLGATKKFSHHRFQGWCRTSGLSFFLSPSSESCEKRKWPSLPLARVNWLSTNFGEK